MGLDITCLNPFMNQVYFYPQAVILKNFGNMTRLNPFMNQVYFYVAAEHIVSGNGKIRS